MAKSRYTPKKIWGWGHRWLGLLSGLVVFVVALTGAMLTFQYPIEKRFLQPQAWYVNKPSTPYLPLGILLAKANQQLKQFDDYHPANAVFMARDSTHVVQIGYNYNDEKGDNHRAYALLNPYTAETTFLRQGNAEHWIWAYIVELHIDLLLGEVGSYLVKWGTLIFLIQLLSGLVLWWPKNQSAFKQRIWFRWTNRTQWRRQNYDLHNILGFYAAWIVLFMALTGAMWSFEWFNRGVYFGLSLGKSIPTVPTEAKGKATFLPHTSQVFSRSLQTFRQVYPEEYAKSSVLYIGYFATEKDSLMDVMAIYDPIGLRGEKNMEAMIDKSTFKVRRDNLGNYATLAGSINSSTNELHYGTYFGLKSQVLTFFACLIAASLPISGLYIWLGRTKKKGITNRLAMKNNQ